MVPCSSKNYIIDLETLRRYSYYAISLILMFYLICSFAWVD